MSGCDRSRSVRRAALGAIAVLAVGTVRPAGAAEADCRELEQNYNLARASIVSVQRNAALFGAAATGCVALARRLMADGASPLARDRQGAMPLALAARGGSVALVELFLAAGAPIDSRDLNGATALGAAAESERPATAAALLSRGADPNLAGRSGVSALAAAAYRGNDRIVELLLARGADPDHVDDTGKSPIVYAAARGFDIVVRRLLDAGVDPRARYGNDLTALMWAAGHEDGVGSQAAVTVIDRLVAHGATIDAADNRGRTALMIAAERGDAGVVAALMRRGADRMPRDNGGTTAYDLAADDAVRELLGNPGRVTTRPDMSRAP